MALLLVLFTAILAFSLASTDQCVSSPGSSIDLILRSHNNASGDWIITVDTRRLTRKDNPREFSVNVQHETRICGMSEIEEHVSMAFVYPSLHDTSMPGAIEPSTTATTTTTTTTTTSPPSSTTATPSTTTTTAMPSTTATPSTTTTSTTPSTTGTPSTTTTTVTASTNATPSTKTTSSTTSPRSCPPGYQLYPGYNCYKAFSSRGEQKTWSEARQQCIRDGGDLMVIDSEREREDVYLPLYKSVSFYNNPWVGVYKANNDWTTVKGQPALSTWWWPGWPDGNAASKCACAEHTGLLFNWDCADTEPFICEISL